MTEVALDPCAAFEATAESAELCQHCRWPLHFHAGAAQTSPRPLDAVSPRFENSPSPRGGKSSPRRGVGSGLWGAAKPSEDAVAKRTSGVLRQSWLASSASSPSSVSSPALLGGAPPNKPLPVLAQMPTLPDSRAPKEVAALLRRMLKTTTVEVEGVEYDGCFTASDLVFALMQHRKWPRAECVEMGRVLLNSGFVARAGTVTQPGFVDSSEHYYILILLPEMASRGGRGSSSQEHAVLQWEQTPSQVFRPVDVRSMVSTVAGSAWRFDYKMQQAYTVYFVHVMVGEEVFTVSRRFADLAELHRLLLKRYAARVLPTPPKGEQNIFYFFVCFFQLFS
jgi:hypothetical protein